MLVKTPADLISVNIRSTPSLLHIVDQQEHVPMSEANPQRTPAVNMIDNDPTTSRFTAWFRTVVPFYVTNMVGCFVLVRHPSIVGEEGVVLSAVLTALCALCASLTSVSLEALFNNNARVSQSASLYNILRMNLGRELASSLCLLHIVGKVLLTAVFSLGAAETVLWDNDDSDLAPLSASSQLAVLALVLLASTSAVVAVQRRGVFVALLFLALLLTLTTYVAAALGIAVNAGVNSALYSPLASTRETVQVLPAEESGFAGVAAALSLMLPAYMGFTGSTAFLYSSPHPSGAGGGVAPRRVSNRGSALRTIVSAAVVLTFALFLVIVHGSLLSGVALRADTYIAVRLAWPAAEVARVGLCAALLGAALYNCLNSAQLLHTVALGRAVPFLQLLRPAPGLSDALRDKRGSIEAPKVPRHRLLLDDAAVARLQQTQAHTLRLRGMSEQAFASVSDSDSSDSEAITDPPRRGLWHSWRYFPARVWEVARACVRVLEQYTREDAVAALTLRNCALLFLLVALCCVCGGLWGGLDTLAPVAAVLHLLVYCVVNGVCLAMVLIKGCAYKLPLHLRGWLAPCTGLLLSAGLALLINWWLLLLALAALALLWFYCAQHRVFPSWGEAFYGAVFQLTRNLLLALSSSDGAADEAKDALLASPLRLDQLPTVVVPAGRPHDWRPRLLVIARVRGAGTEAEVEADMEAALPNYSSNYRSSNASAAATSGARAAPVLSGSGRSGLRQDVENTVRLATEFRTDEALIIVGAILRAELSGPVMQQARAAERLLQAFLSRESLPVFASVAVAPEVTAAVQIALQTAGLGAMRPNAVMAVWPQEWRRLQAAALDKHVLKYKAVLAAQKALLLVKGAAHLPDSPSQRRGGTVDIWWVLHDGGLLLLLAHLLTRHEAWRACSLRLFVVLTTEEDSPQELQRRVEAHLRRAQLAAQVEVVRLLCPAAACRQAYEHTVDIHARLRLLESVQRLRAGPGPTVTLALHRPLDSSDGKQEVLGHRSLHRFEEVEGVAARKRPLADLFAPLTSAPVTPSAAQEVSHLSASGTTDGGGSALEGAVTVHDQYINELHTGLLVPPVVAPSQSPLHSGSGGGSGGSSPEEMREPAGESSPTAIPSVSVSAPVASAVPLGERSIFRLRGPLLLRPVIKSQAREMREPAVESSQYAAPGSCSNRISASMLVELATPARDAQLTREHWELALTEEATAQGVALGVDPRRLRVALALNWQLKERSRAAALILTNLPLTSDLPAAEMMAYVSCLTEEVGPVLLVRGCGHEIITSYTA